MRLNTPQYQPRNGPPPLTGEDLDADARDTELEHQDHAPAHLNDSEREALLLNLDVSLRVSSRPQLFSWVQGALQSLIQHEVLL